MPFNASFETKENSCSKQLCAFFRHLFIKFERIAFAYHFACTDDLSWTSDITYSGSEAKLANKPPVPLSKTTYKDYPIMSYAMVQMGLASELNDCFKALIRGDKTWASEILKPIHTASGHSYVCILLISMKLILMFSQHLDRNTMILMMQLNPNINRLKFCTYLLSAYWSVFSEKLIQLFKRHFSHECHGEKLESCDPEEELFKFGKSSKAKMYF